MKDYENFYHCVSCRRVVYLEETERKVLQSCPDCGPSTHFKIEITEGEETTRDPATIGDDGGTDASR